MKIGNSIVFVVAMIAFSSCIRFLPEEDSREFASENEWIYDVMKTNYLFRDDMPTNPDLSQNPLLFFNSLLSLSQDRSKGGSFYSRIEDKEPTRTRSSASTRTYGFKYVLYSNSGEYLTPRVIYVMKNSPAERAGLKRGDFIFRIDNERITTLNMDQLESGGGREFSVSNIYPAQEEMLKLKIAPSEVMDDRPLHLYSTITQNGKKIAYVVYNHFTAGLDDDLTKDRRYDDELCSMSQKFSQDGVSEMVLDLRYNGGGLISSAQLLATMIVPNSEMGKTFCILKDVQDKYMTYKFDPEVIRNGRNLNLKRLYVLTTRYTASASELIINCLRPYMEVVIIGEKTEGKNVGSIHFKHERYPHTLRPITCYVYNQQNRADYRDGFSPDYQLTDFKLEMGTRQYSLGDPNEALLNVALRLINGEPVPSDLTKSAIQTKHSDVLFQPVETGIILEE